MFLFCLKSNEFWRTGLEIYFLYKLHLNKFQRSLRPSFPSGILDFDFPNNFEGQIEYFEKLKGRIEHFFETFLEICGDELQLLKEFHDFLDYSLEVCVPMPI